MFTSFKAQLSSFLLSQGFFSRRETRCKESKEFSCILNKISRNSEEFYMRKREKTTVADKYTSNKNSSNHIQFRHIEFKLVIPISNHSYQTPIHDTKYNIFIIGQACFTLCFKRNQILTTRKHSKCTLSEIHYLAISLYKRHSICATSRDI